MKRQKEGALSQDTSRNCVPKLEKSVGGLEVLLGIVENHLNKVEEAEIGKNH